MKKEAKAEIPSPIKQNQNIITKKIFSLLFFFLLFLPPVLRAQSDTATPTVTATPFVPSCVQLYIYGNSSEVPNGYGSDGLPVYPAQGYQGAVRINSGGSVNFSAFENTADGVYFGASNGNCSGVKVVRISY